MKMIKNKKKKNMDGLINNQIMQIYIKINWKIKVINYYKQ